jgi:hypothetical protein
MSDGRESHRFRAVMRDRDVVPRAVEHGAECIAHVRIVFDQ